MTVLVYQLTCRATGKSYIGITSRSLKIRWQAHVRDARIVADPSILLQRAIRAHGPDAFDLRVLRVAQTRVDACEIEKTLIQTFGTRAPAGYNATVGGDGGPTRTGAANSPEHRRRISAANMGRQNPPESIAATAAKLRGRKLPDAHAAILRAAGRKNKGKIRTEAQKLAEAIQRHEGLLLKEPCLEWDRGRWRVRIKHNGKRRYVGRFPDKESAIAAYRTATERCLAELRATQNTLPSAKPQPSQPP